MIAGAVIRIVMMGRRGVRSPKAAILTRSEGRAEEDGVPEAGASRSVDELAVDIRGRGFTPASRAAMESGVRGV